MANDSYAGQRQNNSGASEFNARDLQIKMILARIETATLVQVKAVATGAMTVDVQPLVGQVDGDGNVTPHGVVRALPYAWIMAGTSAVKMTPVVGDIGVAVFASRDISSAKANRAPSPPGSRRKYNMADGVYMMGLAYGAPTRFIEFAANSINITDPTAVNVSAPLTTITGALAITGEATINGIKFTQHKHTSTTAGTPTSTPLPTP